MNENNTGAFECRCGTRFRIDLSNTSNEKLKGKPSIKCPICGKASIGRDYEALLVDEYIRQGVNEDSAHEAASLHDLREVAQCVGENIKSGIRSIVLEDMAEWRP